MSGEYSLSDVLEKMYQNQLALEAALMELTLQAEKQGLTEVGDNVRGALGARRSCESLAGVAIGGILSFRSGALTALVSSKKQRRDVNFFVSSCI